MCFFQKHGVCVSCKKTIQTKEKGKKEKRWRNAWIQNKVALYSQQCHCLFTVVDFFFHATLKPWQSLSLRSLLMSSLLQVYVSMDQKPRNHLGYPPMSYTATNNPNSSIFLQFKITWVLFVTYKSSGYCCGFTNHAYYLRFHEMHLLSHKVYIKAIYYD